MMAGWLSGDEVVQAALASLPSSASSGVPTLSELQVRYGGQPC